jgi:LmbE family N-acetylglucosaminyl deacetylase
MEKILMIIAHPDDEILFGYHDIYHNDVTIICMTNANNKIRLYEFNEVAKMARFSGFMLSLKDGINETCDNYTVNEIIDIYIKPLIKTEYNKIVSHDEFGEYGHKQHKKVNEISKELSKILNIPFSTFRERAKKSDLDNKDYCDTQDKLINIYKSQKNIILNLKSFIYM